MLTMIMLAVYTFADTYVVGRSLGLTALGAWPSTHRSSPLNIIPSLTAKERKGLQIQITALLRVASRMFRPLDFCRQAFAG